MVLLSRPVFPCEDWRLSFGHQTVISGSSNFFPQWIFKDNLLRKNFREVFIFNKKLFSFSFLFQYPPSDAAYPPTVGGYPHPASGAYPPGGSGYPPAGGAYPPQPGFPDAGYGGGNFKSRRKYKPTIKPPEHNVKLMSFNLVTLRQVKQIFKKKGREGFYPIWSLVTNWANSERFLFHHKSPFRDKFRDIFISPEVPFLFLRCLNFCRGFLVRDRP